MKNYVTLTIYTTYRMIVLLIACVKASGLIFVVSNLYSKLYVKHVDTSPFKFSRGLVQRKYESKDTLSQSLFPVYIC